MTPVLNVALRKMFAFEQTHATAAARTRGFGERRELLDDWVVAGGDVFYAHNVSLTSKRRKPLATVAMPRKI
jgi:hypothetical protein